MITLEPLSVPIITQRYQVIAYMIEMLLDHRLDSATQVHYSVFSCTLSV